MLCFALGVLLDVLASIPRWGEVARGALSNPDSYMRLVRLRAIVDAHQPLHAVARDGSGGGTVLAWSHLLDSVLLALAWPLGAALEPDAALYWVAVAAGPLSVGALCAALAWALAPLTERQWRWIAAVPACLSVPVLGYGMPGVLHHHVLLAVCAVMVAGWAARGAERGAVAGHRAGAWAALGLWLSPETMPFILMAFAGLVLLWTKPGAAASGRRAGEAGRALGATLLALTVAIVAVDPPSGGVLAAEIDRVSIVFVGMAAALLAAGCALGAADRRAAPPHRTALGLLGAAVPLALWIATNPKILLGPEGLLTAEQTRAMFGVIGEMRPVTTLDVGAMMTLPGALGAAAVIAMAWRRRTRLWTYASACAVALVALGMLHARFSTYGAALGAGMLPVAIAEVSRALSRAPRLLDRLAVIALFVAGPPALHLADAGAAAPGSDRVCLVMAERALLAPATDAVVLADPSDTPELLYRTRVLTVGSFYHRNPDAFMRLRAAWRSAPSATEPDAVRATGAAFILACPGRPRSLMVLDLPDTLSDQLNRGEVPGWLTVAGRTGGGAVLYRVAGGAGAVTRPWRLFGLLALLPTLGVGVWTWTRADGVRAMGGHMLVVRDYAWVWGASTLLAAGDSATIFRPMAFAAWVRGVFGPGLDDVVWSYPPPMLLLVWPAARLGIVPGFCAYGAALLALLYVAARVAGVPRPWLVLLSPAAIEAFLAGQNGALTAALLTGGLSLLGRRPIAAGALLGVLCVKPQTALLVPVCLLAARNGRAAAAAAITAGVLAAASVAAFGPNCFVAFWTEVRPHMTGVLQADWHGLFYQRVMVTAFMAARSAGAGLGFAWAVQAAASMVAAACAWRLWRDPAADPAARVAATLCLAVLATPYGYTYDMVGVAVAVAILFGTVRGAAAVVALALGWAWPGWALPASFAGLPDLGAFAAAAVACVGISAARPAHSRWRPPARPPWAWTGLGRAG